MAETAHFRSFRCAGGSCLSAPFEHVVEAVIQADDMERCRRSDGWQSGAVPVEINEHVVPAELDRSVTNANTSGDGDLISEFAL